MKLDNLKISSQINFHVGAIFAIVIVLLVSSFVSVNVLWGNTVALFNHPMTVRRAVGEIKVDVLLIHRDMRQLVFEHDPQEMERIVSNIATYEASIARQLLVLYDRYLGPHSDIDEAAEAFTRWKVIRAETIRLLQAGQIVEAENRVKASGVGGAQADQVLGYFTRISDFASGKGDELFEVAREQRDRVIGQLIFLCVSALLLLAGVSRYLRKGILPPLAKLTSAIEAISQGILDTRIQNESPNELGEVSRAFNAMSGTIKREIEYKENAARVSSAMFRHSTLRPFCQELLKNLLVLTDSQISAIYFLNEVNDQFERYESIGAKQSTLASFSAAGREGEFGAALAAKEVQHITEIPADVKVVFSTVSGEYQAKEILTIPIVNGADVIAVISLASIKGYSTESVRLINGLANEITASLSAVLASQRSFEFQQELQSTNTELAQQARELAMQADELTQQNAELEVQKRQLDQASRLKTNFVSNMSHELRTPLNSVIALSGVLSRRLADKIPAEEWSYLEIIERNGRNLLMLINDILDISRIESGREEIEVSKFNANQAIAEVMAMLQPQAQQQGTDLLHKLRDVGIIVQSDVHKLRHILQNVIGNAVKFTERGTVEVVATQTGDNIEIVVNDTGIGIPAEHLPHIFDEFRQADSSTTRRFGGTGLGLAISKKYANLLGGTIKVRSSPDIGSEFTITLPLQYVAGSQEMEQARFGADETEPVRATRKDYPDLSEKIVLLVEDNESSIIQIKDLIASIGCQVQVARSAGEAFTIIDQVMPDAMILDLMMPDVDGFRVLDMLRNAERTANIPVLILTAKHITKEELTFLKRNNVHQLIQKGDVKRAELQKAVVDLLYPDIVEERLASKLQVITGKPVVLVVEDNPDNMVTVRALLEGHHIVLEAIDAREGIEMAKIHLPNLILMDIALPDINGIEAFRLIRKMPQLQHIPIIALTASVMKHDRETILSHGFDAFIAKPIIANEFFIVINEVLYGK